MRNQTRAATTIQTTSAAITRRRAHGRTTRNARGALPAMTCESPRYDAEPRAGIAIFARRELVRPHPGANSLLPLEMIDAETIRKGEVPCRHRLIDPVDLPAV